jgi:adenylylsulfate kinase-like enzyme
MENKLKGKLPGIWTPYEVPEDPEVQVDSYVLSPCKSARNIMAYVKARWVG